jgi:DNA-binding NarL/FixJ family response regulator
VITVLLIDDHEAFRKGFRMMLELSPDIRVTGEYSSKDDLPSILNSSGPDLVFIDVHLRNINCFDLTAYLHDLYPSMKIVLLSMFTGERYETNGKQAGASALLIKTAISASLTDLLQSLFPGIIYPRDCKVKEA